MSIFARCSSENICVFRSYGCAPLYNCVVCQEQNHYWKTNWNEIFCESVSAVCRYSGCHFCRLVFIDLIKAFFWGCWFCPFFTDEIASALWDGGLFVGSMTEAWVQSPKRCCQSRFHGGCERLFGAYIVGERSERRIKVVALSWFQH